MRKFFLYTLVIVLSGCASVPITHRRQLSLVSEYEIIETSKSAYSEFLSQHDIISPYNPNSILVKKVGNKLAKACEKFLRDHGDVERLANFDWEFTLIEGTEKNAWCMPGGKVVVYEGILSVTENELGLAVVLSHEIAHAVARHGSERMSQQLMASYGADVLSVVVGAIDTKGIDLQDVLMGTYDVGSQVGLLKFSRNQETEADKMGLVFMEYAGYDCNEAIDFWKRMASNSSGGVPIFLSTHPADYQRIQDITEFIPVAKSYIH